MKPLHIFKPGKHTAMSGDSFNFSESDLAATVRAYSPALHEAPLVIGHPKHDAPAAGWVKSLQATPEGLIAESQQVDPAFAELVSRGSYKKISASFYHPDSPSNPVPGVYYLRHVGFLGAQPPSIKGLRPIELADADEGVIEFGDFGHEVSSGLWRRFREFLIGQFGAETADKVAPSWEIESLAEIGRRPEPGVGPYYAESQPTTTEVNTVTTEEQAALQADNERLKAQLAKREKAEKVAAQEAIHAANTDFAEALVASGMKPVHVAAVVAALDFADSGAKPLEFGEADDRQPLSEGLKAVFQELTGAVSFGEQASKARAGKTMDKSVNPLVADAEARTNK
ncbi:peptidase [Pseudomonas sp. NPDC089734]|uniref:peptidase n=1 Tax=Pseudomonas sp. NPDC089734 TaxID=3364469 RepID=UPI0037FDC045